MLSTMRATRAGSLLLVAARTSSLRTVGVAHARQLSFFDGMMKNLKKSLNRDEELRGKLDDLEKKTKEFEESEAVRKAKETLSKAKTDAEKVTESVSQKVKEAFKNMSDSDLAKKTKEELEELAKESKKFSQNVGEKFGEKLGDQGKKFSEKVDEVAGASPYLKQFASTIKEASEDLVEGTRRSSRLYGGFRDAEERRIERDRRERIYNQLKKQQEERINNTEANPDAGAGIVLHKDSRWKESWNNFKDNNPFMQRLFTLRRSYEESDNPLVHYLHKFQDSVMGIFAETEHAQVIKEIKMIDPTFNVEEFTKEMHDYIIPEVLESFLHGNKRTLKEWCSEAAYNVLMATVEERQKAGHHVDSRILELKGVDLAMAKMIDERPVLIYTFNTQQITVIRDNSGKIIEGQEDDVESVHYVMAMVKESDSTASPLTAGWKVMEIGIQATMKTW